MTIIDPKYSIGIDEMDTQHARWIFLIEKFRSAASGHLLDQCGFAAAHEALDQLLAYTRTHFASEMQFMERHGFPGLREHQEKHKVLEQQVIKLLDEIASHKTSSTPLKLNLLVTIWLMEHILQEDIKYARFILSKG